MRIRLYRTISTYLQALGGIVTLIVVLSPKWGSTPQDFYLGYPRRFYVTQYDVMGEHVRLPALLFDLAVVGLPAFLVVLLLHWLMRRVLIRHS